MSSIRTKLDRAIVRKPALEPNERVVVETPANREVAALRNVGGMLFVTDRRIHFAPTFVERWMRAKSWQRSLSAVRRVRAPERELRKAFAGGLGSRLEVEFDDGSVETFVLANIDEVSQALEHG